MRRAVSRQAGRMVASVALRAIRSFANAAAKTAAQSTTTKPKRVPLEKLMQPPATYVADNYRLVASMVVERPPMVTPEDEPWEAAWAEFQEERDEKTKKEIPAEYYENRDEDEIKEFIPASHITPQDKTNNRHSLIRQLRESLFLIVKVPGDQHAWHFPRVALQDNETVRKGAARALAERCGQELETHILGNSPIGHYAYDFVKDSRDAKASGKQGDKVFFMHSIYVDGLVKLDKKSGADFLWVTKQELKEYLSPELLVLTSRMLVAQEDYKLGHKTLQEAGMPSRK